ncbi:MAG: LrgB family protein [Alphaproteobacteria bacterium]
MPSAVTDVWVYLSANPLLWLTATMAAYVAGHWLYVKSGENSAVNSVAIAVAILIGLLWSTGTDYARYFDGAQFVHFMLGPAVVALAVPLYENRAEVRRTVLPILAALFAGSITAVVSAVVIAAALGASMESITSLAPKSVTSPIAMGIAERIGGLPSLTAGLVILTGILGAIIGTPLFNAMGMKDWRARGFAMGVTAHGIGTARAFQVNDVAGTFAAIALGLNGIVTAILVPVLILLFL